MRFVHTRCPAACNTACGRTLVPCRYLLAIDNGFTDASIAIAKAIPMLSLYTWTHITFVGAQQHFGASRKHVPFRSCVKHQANMNAYSWFSQETTSMQCIVALTGLSRQAIISARLHLNCPTNPSGGCAFGKTMVAVSLRSFRPYMCDRLVERWPCI